jgi:two-component system, NarL family, sensor histidine kinase LiaS
LRYLLTLFRGLRGKLTLTYTLVTVLALLALQIVVLTLALVISSASQTDTRAYLSDVVYTLAPQASKFLQPGAQDLPGLQEWAMRVHAAGYASEEPINAFDSPAAKIVQVEPLYVLSPQRVVLAQAPANGNSRIGRQYTPSSAAEQNIFNKALDNNHNLLNLVSGAAGGNFLMAVPVTQNVQNGEVLAVILLTIRPAPAMLLQVWPTLLGWVLGTGIILILLVIPFGTLFGFIMSRGLTRRLDQLSSAAEAWSEGDFRPLPSDTSKDEIGSLGRRMRHMAERLQALLQTQQQLALIEERNRLARELHDTVKQQAFATLMQVRAARNLLDSDPAAARQHMEEAEALVKTSQQDLGLIIAELRPAALDGKGLAEALQEFAETWAQHTRIPIEISIHNKTALPLHTEQALYRVAQEGLSNVARHSSASVVRLRLAYAAEQVELSIHDNGVGFDSLDPAVSGFGLQSMQERLAALSGCLKVESSPGNGTMLTATIPSQGG